MKKTTSVKSKPKSEANPNPTPPPPPQDQQAAEKIGGPTPAVRPCSPAETQKGHHEVVQS